jgi:carnitine-CoA ligase
MTPLEVISQYRSHDYTLTRFFDARTQVHPSRPCLVYDNKTWTWGEINVDITGIARMLAARGIHKGDRVGIMAANTNVHILLLFALARIGAIMVPVNPEFGAAEAQYVLTHAGVSAVICSMGTLRVVREATRAIDPQPWFALVDGEAPGIPQLATLIKDGGDATLPSHITPDDTCIIIYTSGTTGFPKGVMHSQRNFVLAGERHVARVHLQPDDRALCILPMFHMNALFNVAASVVAAGACLIIAPRFSASRFWELAADTGATQVNVMAAISTILARRPRSEFVARHKLRVVNGSGFTQETLDVFKNEFGVPTVIEGLGMTEIPGAFSNPFEGPHKLGCMGKPGVHPDPARAWTQARILDEDRQDVPDYTAGELAVRIPTLMQGYYRDPEQTAAAFCDGWFMTGDLVRRDADGYFHFIARKKDIIRRRGENIAAAELDRVISEHPRVSEVAAIAVDAELGDDEIMAVVVPKSTASLTANDVRAWCAERLAAHKVPRFVVFVEQLPHTPTHKVAKHILKQDASLRARASDSQATC